MTLTFDELNSLNLWDEYCALTETDVWACNEGTISETDELPIPDVLRAKILAGSKS